MNTIHSLPEFVHDTDPIVSRLIRWQPGTKADVAFRRSTGCGIWFPSLRLNLDSVIGAFFDFGDKVIDQLIRSFGGLKSLSNISIISLLTRYPPGSMGEGRHTGDTCITTTRNFLLSTYNFGIPSGLAQPRSTA